MHSHYTFLEVGKTAAEPHNKLCRLSINGNTSEHPNLVIGIGCLFFDLGNGKAERNSGWAGYKVFLDKELALWLVFDRLSIDPQAKDWYPFPCRLSHPTLQDSGDEQRVISSTSKERRFDIVYFLPFLHDLANAELKKASEKVQEKIPCGEMRVCQVERGEIDKLLETESAPQEVSVDNPNQLCEAILNAVGEGRMTMRKR